MSNILVTGGTGTLGKRVVEYLLNNEDLQIYVLTSKENPGLPAQCQTITGNLAANTNLKTALNDIEIVIHCASNPRNPQKVDVEGTNNLLNALNRSKINHFIFISIVGVDKTDYSYYQAKFKVEKMIKESGVPFSILRTTQFHNLVLNIIHSLEQSQSHIVVPSGLQFQSVAVQEVADRLGALVKENPAGLLPDMVGPEVLTFEEMVKIYLNNQGQNKEVKLLPLEGERINLFRSEVNISSSEIKGTIRWKQFLQEIKIKA
ncbi:SDR family oxidoreductase [Adhaeribacter radiodurans]|uniref:NAD(P)H-binding protein n=1 Tax=Adhaeribacter radiodurans TaxID=2745197 RepID=A0A7L7LDC1_9BACT|nr:NAD(P)H-binding protein [Adhaeribacter radiodurans]QMU30811.1 NAD(P)H-binding protein [Adhaeribacter radiodurans]